MKNATTVLWAVTLLIGPTAFAAEVPGVLVHQGYLRDKAGNPVTGGVGIVVGMYTNPTDDGGLPVWEEDLGEVLVTNGFYYAEIGTKSAGLPGVLSANGKLYLELKVGGDKLSPRQLIGAVPYAQVCRDATGDIHPASVTVGTTKVIDETGKWTGDTSGWGTVKNVGTAAPLSGGPISDTGTISMPKADGATSGYLSGTDWTTFNGKQNRVMGACVAGYSAVAVEEDGDLVCDARGTVTEVKTGLGLTGGPVISTGTISLDTAYVDAQYVNEGQATSISTVMLQDAAVTSTKLVATYADGSTYDARFVNEGQTLSVSTAMLQNDAVTTPKIPDGAVTSTKLAASFADGSAHDARFVNEAQPDAVSTAMLQNDSVTSSKLDTAFKDGSAYDTRFVNASGDTMTSNLGLPADGLTVGTDQLVCVGGRVGIGTTNPTKTLDIGGDGKINLGVPAVSHGNINTPQNLYVSIDSNNDCPSGSCSFSIHTGGEDASGPNLFNVFSNGNVGIGTTAPSQTLEVKLFTDNGDIVGFSVPSIKNTFLFERYNDGMFGTAKFKSAINHPIQLAPGGNTAVHITAGGSVGIGTTSPGYLLHVNGSAGKPGGGSWTDSSDIRLKKNVKTLEGSLAKMLRLRGVNFEWKDPEKHGNIKGVQTGMIAQDVEKVFPEWVGTDKDGFKDLTFRGFEALTVEAMREMNGKVEKLSAENDALKKRLEALETTVAAREENGVKEGKTRDGAPSRAREQAAGADMLPTFGLLLMGLAVGLFVVARGKSAKGDHDV